MVIANVGQHALPGSTELASPTGALAIGAATAEIAWVLHTSRWRKAHHEMNRDDEEVIKDGKHRKSNGAAPGALTCPSAVAFAIDGTATRLVVLLSR